MQTKIYQNIDTAGLNECGKMLRQGQIVAFPTETVYGLGASALCDKAVAAIFAAKNRPSDNPLIAHISDLSMLPMVAKEVPKEAKELFELFSPGPLTVILPKADGISPLVTAGGDTVAVRCPAHPIARALITAAGVPIVAPSANLSGKPSPTDFAGTLEDLDGLVPAIIDGGECQVGVESTVLPPKGNTLRILRPGAVTAEMLRAAGFEVEIDPNILAPLDDKKPVLSPGMKHRHYAPKAPLTIVKGEKDAVLDFLRAEQAAKHCCVLCYNEELDALSQGCCIPVGARDDLETQAKRLFAALRESDATQAEIIYAHLPPMQGLGLALYNRMIRAAAHTVLKI